MKKWLMSLLAAVLLLSFVMIVPAAADGSAGEYVTIFNPSSPEGVDLRYSPSEAALSKGRYYNGVTVKVISVNNANWVYVSIGGETAGKTGYMPSRYLVNPSRNTVVPTSPFAYVSNVYGTALSMPGLIADGRVATMQLPMGMPMVVLGTTATEAHVQANGITGTVKLKDLSMGAPVYTTVVTPRPTATPAPTPAPTMAPNYNVQYPWFPFFPGYSYPVYATPAPTETPRPTATPFSFMGPVGNYTTAVWPLEPELDEDENPVPYAVVNNPNPRDKLNFRAEPKRGAHVYGKYYNGVQVKLEGEPFIAEDGNRWAKVTIGNLTGYMDANFLAFPETDELPVSMLPVMYVYNTNSAKNLHLRESQSLNAPSLGIYPNGTQFVLLGYSDEWCHVIVDGQYGFMRARYVRK